MSELARCKPWIEAALEYSGGTHSFEDIAAGIAQGTLQFWPAERGCLVTEILRHPQKTVLNVFLGGGEMDQLLDMIPSVEGFAKANGCDGLTMFGRPGWQRVIPGAKVLHVVLGKDFTWAAD